jgi:hypothetical protein
LGVDKTAQSVCETSSPVLYPQHEMNLIPLQKLARREGLGWRSFPVPALVEAAVA